MRVELVGRAPPTDRLLSGAGFFAERRTGARGSEPLLPPQAAAVRSGIGGQLGVPKAEVCRKQAPGSGCQAEGCCRRDEDVRPHDAAANVVDLSRVEVLGKSVPGVQGIDTAANRDTEKHRGQRNTTEEDDLVFAGSRWRLTNEALRVRRASRLSRVTGAVGAVGRAGAGFPRRSLRLPWGLKEVNSYVVPAATVTRRSAMGFPDASAVRVWLPGLTNAIAPSTNSPSKRSVHFGAAHESAKRERWTKRRRALRVPSLSGPGRLARARGPAVQPRQRAAGSLNVQAATSAVRDRVGVCAEAVCPQKRARSVPRTADRESARLRDRDSCRAASSAESLLTGSAKATPETSTRTANVTGQALRAPRRLQ